MRKLLFITILLLFPPYYICAQSLNDENRALFDSLDRVLEHVDDYDKAKEAELDLCKHKLQRTTDPEERYWVTRELYVGYSSFMSDSALRYSEMALDIARGLNRMPWINEILLKRAYILAATGMFNDASEALAGIEKTSLTPRAFIEYHETEVFIQTHIDQFAGVRNELLPYSEATLRLLYDICSDIPVNDPDYYWLVGWKALRSEESAAAMIPNLREALRDCAYTTRTDAKNAWMLSALYSKTGDSEKRLTYLIYSAMADIRGSVREIASLEEIARILFETGDLDHANRYISFCIRCANLYHSRVRIVGMARLQYDISTAYAELNRAQERKITGFMWALVIILIILSGSLVVIIKQLGKIHSRERELNKANNDIRQRCEELQDTRQQLIEANKSLAELYSSAKEDAKELADVNAAKEKYITDIFAICSDDISKLDDFRKRINRLIMAGRFDEVRELTKSPELSHAELKELYANFDRIFLQIYPDFVRDFNELLRPEERIELKKGELLNTELRIYALVRLGLNDSVKISHFLHCSVQTVYNTRMKIRNKSDIPRDRFAATVRSLGKAVI